MQQTQDDGIGGTGTEATVTPIRSSGIFGTTVAEMVFRAMGVDPLEHNRGELLDVMQHVATAFDALDRQRRHGWHGTGQDSHLNRHNRLVEALRDGVMMSDLYDDDDTCRAEVLMNWDDVLATLTKKSNASKPSRIPLMDQLDWYRLEQAVDHGERAGRPLARELGIGLSSLQNLFGLYKRAGRLNAERYNHA